jgi:single-strand DNA-binding protein
MPNLNKVMLMGNLTRDPELRQTQSGHAVCNIGMACNREWTNKNTNEKQQETTFVDCQAWGKPAEIINQYLKKGAPIYVEGRLRLEQWADKDGVSRTKLKVVVDNFQFLSSGQSDSAQPPVRQASDPIPDSAQPPVRQAYDPIPDSAQPPVRQASDPIPNSDIPF